MKIPGVPVAYEPGRFRIDARFSSAAVWLSLLSPVLVRAAVLHPEQITASPVPNISLLLCAFCTLLLGVLALPFWFDSSQAAVIYAEGSERKRYLLMGFAGRLENRRDSCKTYLSMCRSHCAL